MKTDSLRIGNYVLCAGKVIAVTSVFPKGINAHTDRITGKVSYIPADRIDPIPLSTDMLQRLGMRRNAVRWVKYGVDNLYVDRAVDKFYISIGRLGERVCQVRFVHQLQNILSDGSTPKISMIRLAGICSSHHLKIKTPSGFNTRIHSSNPCFRSVSHVDNNLPYLCAM